MWFSPNPCRTSSLCSIPDDVCWFVWLPHTILTVLHCKTTPPYTHTHPTHSVYQPTIWQCLCMFTYVVIASENDKLSKTEVVKRMHLYQNSPYINYLPIASAQSSQAISLSPSLSLSSDPCLSWSPCVLWAGSVWHSDDHRETLTRW